MSQPTPASSVFAVLLVFLLASALVACGPTSEPQTATSQNDEAAQPVEPAEQASSGESTEAAEVVRLGDNVLPTHYTLELKIDPAAPTFSGTTTIDLEVGQETDEILLHARDLQFETIDLLLADDTALTGEASTPGPDLVKLSFGQPIPPGAHRLTLGYSAPLPESLKGLYRVQVEEDWYAFTQFEPLSARAAFPSFDEPIFKVPFSIVLTTPSDLVAATNTPLVRSSKVEDGWTRHVYAESKPMPTYLVAFAVGPFDVVEAPADAIPNVPFRILTAKGKGDQVQYALDRTPPILKALSDYFGEPYPYAKLDFVAVPNFGAGAMENVGLVTYRETRLMVAEDAPPSQKRSAQSVIAHELAHMWFGNLVSPTWWDEIWLNEAFATWMASKAMEVAAPELEPRLGMIRWISWVKGTDSTQDARAIRQPIEDTGDIYGAFDGITYGKGAAVLTMLESWIGEETFRKGVRSYLDEHRWGNATTSDLLSALEQASGRDLTSILDAFVNQPGVPLVEASVTCSDDGPMTLELSQSRYLPLGSEATQGEPWTVPVCLGFGYGDKVKEECVLLEVKKANWDFDHGGCPDWVQPNVEARGYYYGKLEQSALLEMLEEHRDHLGVEEKIALTSLLTALFESGDIDVQTYMASVESLAREEHHGVVQAVLGSLYMLRSSVVPEEMWDGAFARWSNELLEPHFQRLGTSPRDGEPATQRMLRPSVVSAMVTLADSSELKKKANEATTRFLEDRGSVPMDVAQQSLPHAARDGNVALWESLRAQLDDPGLNAQHRSLIISALGSFNDPDLTRRSLELLLDGTLLGQDARTLLRRAGKRRTVDVAWGWATEHYEEIGELIGKERLSSMPRVGSAYCSKEGRDKVVAFFEDDAHRVPGTDRTLGMTLEQIDQCIRTHKRASSGARTFLEKRAATGDSAAAE